MDFESQGDFESKFGEDYDNAFELEDEIWGYLVDKYDGDIEIATISKEEL